jgi:hypothetical protein
MCGSPNTNPTGAARAELLAKTGAQDEARHAYEVAIGLERNPAVRRFLQRRQWPCPLILPANRVAAFLGCRLASASNVRLWVTSRPRSPAQGLLLSSAKLTSRISGKPCENPRGKRAQLPALALPCS